ncbi:MAG: hypothetical protein IJ088_00425 [Clostridia bacterium]|nr:hypothetical protein [Clostridia bacterium]
MKRTLFFFFLTVLFVFVLGTASAASLKTYRCDEQEFTIQIPAGADASFGNNTLTVYVESKGYIPYVMITRRPLNMKFSNPTNYLNNVYREHMENQYGSNMIGTNPAKNYTYGGKTLIGARYMYKVQNTKVCLLRLIEVREDGDVEYAAKYIDGEDKATLAVLEDVIRTYSTGEADDSGSDVILGGGEDVIGSSGSAGGSSSPATQDTNTLLDAKGITIQLLRAAPSLSKSFPATIRLDLRIVNNSGRKIDISLDNAQINQVSVNGIGSYNLEKGLDSSSKFFLLEAETNEAIREACNPKVATFEIVVKDDANRDFITSATVTLPLDHIPAFTPYPTQAPTPKPTAKPTAKPTTKPSTSSSSSNRSFYGITSMGFSDRRWATWEKKPGDLLNIRFEILAKTRQVKSFELVLYAVDDWGDRLFGGRTYSLVTNRQIARSVTAYSDYFQLPDRSKIKTIYCGIKRVTFTEGPDEEVSDDDIEFYSWDIR